MNDHFPEHVRRFKSNLQSLQRLLVSCETSASIAGNSVSFYPHQVQGWRVMDEATSLSDGNLEPCLYRWFFTFDSRPF